MKNTKIVWVGLNGKWAIATYEDGRRIVIKDGFGTRCEAIEYRKALSRRLTVAL